MRRGEGRERERVGELPNVFVSVRDRVHYATVSFVCVCVCVSTLVR